MGTTPLSATDLESPEATALHSALTSSVIRSNAREILQSSAYGVVYRNRFGRSLDLTDVDAAYALVPLRSMIHSSSLHFKAFIRLRWCSVHGTPMHSR